MYSSSRAASFYYQVSLSYNPLRLFEKAMGLTAVLMIATGDASQKQIHYPKSCSSCPLFHESSRVRQLLEGHVNREARADNLEVVDLERLLEALGNVSHFSHCCGSALTTQSCL